MGNRTLLVCVSSILCVEASVSGIARCLFRICNSTGLCCAPNPNLERNDETVSAGSFLSNSGGSYDGWRRFWSPWSWCPWNLHLRTADKEHEKEAASRSVILVVGQVRNDPRPSHEDRFAQAGSDFFIADAGANCLHQSTNRVLRGLDRGRDPQRRQRLARFRPDGSRL